MGRLLGSLAKSSKMTLFGLSPHEQKAFAGLFSKGMPNFFRRVYGTKHILPWFFAVYYVIQWGNKENHLLALKNPADYADDE